MANKLYDSKGQLIGYIATVAVEKNLPDDLTRVILHTGHELTFRPGELIADRGGNWRIRYGGLNAGKKSTSATNAAAIKRVTMLLAFLGLRNGLSKVPSSTPAYKPCREAQQPG